MDILSISRLRRDQRNRHARVPVRQTRILRDRRNPMTSMNDVQFRRHYRFTKEGVLRLTDLFEPYLRERDARGSPLTPVQRVCLVLSYYGGGHFQHTSGLIAGVQKTCSNTTIASLTDTICQLAPQMIKMPTRQEMRTSANFFEEQFGLPNFAMGVDGTHIRLGGAPVESDLPDGIRVQDFWCRKQFYSLNVQVIGNEKRKLYNIVAQWSGSTHDSRVWLNCRAKQWIENQSQFMIAGDSAYPISTKLMKPYPRPTNRREVQFNRKLSGLRTYCTENLIGIMKRRFPCLKYGLRTKLNLSLDIIVAVGVLHNLALLLNEPEPEESEIDEDDDSDDSDGEHHDPTPTGIAARRAGQARRNWLAQQFC